MSDWGCSVACDSGCRQDGDVCVEAGARDVADPCHRDPFLFDRTENTRAIFPSRVLVSLKGAGELQTSLRNVASPRAGPTASRPPRCDRRYPTWACRARCTASCNLTERVPPPIEASHRLRKTTVHIQRGVSMTPLENAPERRAWRWVRGGRPGLVTAGPPRRADRGPRVRCELRSLCLPLSRSDATNGTFATHYDTRVSLSSSFSGLSHPSDYHRTAQRARIRYRHRTRACRDGSASSVFHTNDDWLSSPFEALARRSARRGSILPRGSFQNYDAHECSLRARQLSVTVFPTEPNGSRVGGDERRHESR